LVNSNGIICLEFSQWLRSAEKKQLKVRSI